MRMLWKASLLATACVLGLAHGNDHGQANDQKFAHIASVQEGSGQSNILDLTECIEINARDSGGYSEGGHQDGRQGGRQGEGHQSGGHQEGGQPAKVCIAPKGAQRGAGAAVGDAHAIVTETVSLGGAHLGGAAISNVHLSFVTHTSAAISTLTHTSTVTAYHTVAAPPPVLIPHPQVVSHPPAVESHAPPPAPPPAPEHTPVPPVRAPENPPAPAEVAPNNASTPVLGIGFPGSFVAGQGTKDSDGQCHCHCLCEPESFPKNSIPQAQAAPEAPQVAPQAVPTTLQTVVSAAQTGPSNLPAAITIPETTIAVPDSLVVATGAPTVPGPIPESTESSSSTSLPAESQAPSIAQAGIPSPESIVDNTTTSTTSAAPEDTAIPTTSDSTTAESTTSSSSTSTTSVSETTSESVASEPTSEPSSSEAAVLPDINIPIPTVVDINTLSLASNLVLGSLAKPTNIQG